MTVNNLLSRASFDGFTRFKLEGVYLSSDDAATELN